MKLERILLLYSFLIFSQCNYLIYCQNFTNNCRRYCFEDAQPNDIETCSCRKNCEYFGDCCEDIHHPELFPWPGTCLKLRFGERQTSLIRIITRCKKNDDFDLTQLCEQVTTDNIVSVIPIYDASRNLSFRNIYCAHCHHVNFSNIVVWPFQIDAKCAKKYLEMKALKRFSLEQLLDVLKFNFNGSNEFVDNMTQYEIADIIVGNLMKASPNLTMDQAQQLFNPTIAQEVLQQGQCDLSFSFRTVSTCSSVTIRDTCLKSASVDDTLKCQLSAQSIVTTNSRVYRNHWCAKCNNVESSFFNKCDEKIRTNPIILGPIISLSSLLDFTFLLSITATNLNENILPSNLSSNTTNVLSVNVTDVHNNFSNMIALFISFSSISLSMMVIVTFGVVLIINVELRKRNSMTVFILAIYVFLSNLAYMLIALQNVLSYSKSMCVTLAVIDHFLNINSFVWSLFIAADICQMLYKSSCGAGANVSLNRMCAVSFCTSALITGCALTADFLAPQWSFSPRFGAVICWINSFRGHILFYFGPTFLVMLANLCIFISTITFLIKAARERLQLRNSGQQMTSYKIILKIALITGLPNIIAFTIVLVPMNANWKEVLDMVYSAIYGLQGAILIISYSTSKNVHNIIKKTFKINLKKLYLSERKSSI